MGGIDESAFDPFDPVEDMDLFKALVGGAIHTSTPASSGVNGLVNSPAVGTFTGFNLDGTLGVSIPHIVEHELLDARATVNLRPGDVGAEVLVLFENGDPRKPIIVGRLKASQAPVATVMPPGGTTITVDDERHVITAEREIVLRCGDASITLTRAGKVIIKGNYVMSRSTGYNKIKGAAVDIN